ncbi:MAG TPA: hypothetical protein VF974_07730 [Patescibacteria group bacterium]
MRLIVTVPALKKRKWVPASFEEDNVVGTVQKGFTFYGEEVEFAPTATLGKWYRDRDGYCYWSGGLAVEADPT